MTDAVERTLDEAGWERPHVAGGSLGGWVALELARRGRAHTAVGVAPGGGWAPAGFYWRFLTTWYALMNRVAVRQARNARAWVSRPRLRRLLTWHHFGRADRLSPELAAHLLESIGSGAEIHTFIASSRSYDAARDLRGIECPVLLAFPERDYVLPYRWCGRRLVEAIPQAQTSLLHGVGHAAMVDDPKLVSDTITGFTARHPGAR
jgi:pimeloyl-ACP methyl ester carboxylesterase